jgi:GH15 family glucan-1,4-alpha-glucosidase
VVVPSAAIAEHGLIGDLQSAALVATDGTIDWFCCPRFDSPSVFAALLDAERGGHFRVRPTEPGATSTQTYQPETAILVTRHISEAGVAEVVDFMPIDQPSVATDRRRIVRAVRGVRGRVELTARIAPRFDYGRLDHQASVDGTTAVFESEIGTLRLTGTMPLVLDGVDVVSTFEVRAGETAGFVLQSGDPGDDQPIGGGEVLDLFHSTERFWRRWLDQCTYRGRWRESVERSAITLKLMTYAPSGGLVAAPTASLPEQVGGSRNWDYRYTWIRDGSFSVGALLGIGFVEEAAAFGAWLRERVADGRVGPSGPLQIMYRVDGSPDLVEEVIDDLEGHLGSRPVRIGNGAADQLQLDIYGEAMHSLHMLDTALGDHGIADEGWAHIAEMIDWLCDHWRDPEEGIWETRGGRRRFTYGQMMSWVAFDGPPRRPTARGRPGDVARWTAERDAVRQCIGTDGWNDTLQAYVQYEQADVLDASLLLMPLMRYVVPNDRRWLSTLDAVQRTLVTDSLVYRYDPLASPDGLEGTEGTFSLCSFLYVDALARSGRLEDARLTFAKMLTYGNHLGLYSEEIDSVGRQIGNFPQAFTHLALIVAAVTLDRRLDAAGERGSAHAAWRVDG